jgi:predicted nucleic acid-binding protein
LLKLYLDTSVILKRCITEPGTETTDIIFDKAETGELAITFSLWNIGEALGVLDEKRRKGWLTEKEFKQTLNLFADELIKLMRLKTLEIIPVQTPILTSTWNLLMNYHIYEADALQITTCGYNNNDALLTSDEKLAQTSRKAGLKTIHIPKDEQELKTLIQQSRKQNQRK